MITEQAEPVSPPYRAPAEDLFEVLDFLYESGSLNVDFERLRRFIIDASYLLPESLPPVARHALGVADAFSIGVANVRQLREARSDCSTYIEASRGDGGDPSVAGVQAVSCALYPSDF